MDAKFTIIALACLMAFVKCAVPTEEEQKAFLKALNNLRTQTGADDLVTWDKDFAEYAADLADSCRIKEFVYEYVSKAKSGYLVDALDGWVKEGKEDQKKGCPRYACGFYIGVIDNHLFSIGCSYNRCPELGGTYVVCNHNPYIHKRCPELGGTYVDCKYYVEID